MIYVFNRNNYSKDKLTSVNINVGDFGVLGTNVSQKDSPISSCKCCGRSQGNVSVSEISKPQANVWESPSTLLKETFGNMNLDKNNQEENFRGSSTSRAVPPKKISLSLAESKEHFNKANWNIPDQNFINLEKSTKKALTSSGALKSDVQKENIDSRKHFKASDKIPIKVEEKNDVKLNEKPIKKSPYQNDAKNEPKAKKFKRIIIQGSDSEDEIPKRIKHKIISSSSSSEETSDSEEQKPKTRSRQQNTKMTRRSTFSKAENYSEEDLIQQVYRYEGIYWEYDKIKKQCFNCFECDKYLIDENVIQHFTRRHSALIAEV